MTEYGLKAANLPNVKEVIHHIQKKSDNIAALMASAAEQLVNKGMQRGIEGRMQQVAANMLCA